MTRTKIRLNPITRSPQLQKNTTIFNEIEKRNLLKKRLVLLLHAKNCDSGSSCGFKNPNVRKSCTMPYCGVMKQVLSHMRTCQNGRLCKTPYCYSSRQIFDHWTNCIDNNCPLCSSLRTNEQDISCVKIS